jgi:hypothetical protein
VIQKKRAVKTKIRRNRKARPRLNQNVNRATI